VGPRGGLAQLTALSQVSAAQLLSPIPDDVPAELKVLAGTLRVLFGALGMSLNRLAAMLHSDPGAVSRYLSGQRIPPPAFIDALFKAVYEARGSLVTEQVYDLVHEQFLVALRAHKPARYEVQRLTDLLQTAAQEKRQSEICVAVLEEAIASRNDAIYKLELEGRQLRSAWARTEGLLEEEREHRGNLQQAVDDLCAQVSALKAQLVSAQRRTSAAEERCRELEALLDRAGAALADEDQGARAGESARSSAVARDRELRELEEAAQVIRAYEVTCVPALLQTEDYARAIILQGASGLDQGEVERLVAVRMSRQELLLGANPPRYWVIVDEAALRRPTGGRTVHVGQVEHLIDLVDLPNVTLQIMPFRYGGHAPDGGAFTVMRFPELDRPDVVYVEYLTGANYVDKPEEVARYAGVLERLSVAGTSPDRTRKILSAMLNDI